MTNIDHKQVMAEADKVTATAGVKVKGNKKYLMVKIELKYLEGITDLILV